MKIKLIFDKDLTLYRKREMSRRLPLVQSTAEGSSVFISNNYRAEKTTGREL